MENTDDIEQQAVEDYLRNAIRETVDEIEHLDPVDLGLDLDLDDLQGRLEPLIVSREIDIETLEHVNSLLRSMRAQMEEWSQFRDNVDSDVDAERTVGGCLTITHARSGGWVGHNLRSPIVIARRFD